MGGISLIIFKEIESYEVDNAMSLYWDSFGKKKKDIDVSLLGMVIGAYLDGELIGIAQIDYINNVFENSKIGYINSFCIKKNYRHQGYGRMLLDECIKIIKLNGGNVVKLTSNKNRVYAHMLYDSMGFEKIDTVFLKKDI